MSWVIWAKFIKSYLLKHKNIKQHEKTYIKTQTVIASTLLYHDSDGIEDDKGNEGDEDDEVHPVRSNLRAHFKLVATYRYSHMCT